MHRSEQLELASGSLRLLTPQNPCYAPGHVTTRFYHMIFASPQILSFLHPWSAWTDDLVLVSIGGRGQRHCNWGYPIGNLSCRCQHYCCYHAHLKLSAKISTDWNALAALSDLSGHVRSRDCHCDFIIRSVVAVCLFTANSWKSIPLTTHQQLCKEYHFWVSTTSVVCIYGRTGIGATQSTVPLKNPESALAKIEQIEKLGQKQKNICCKTSI